MPVETPYDSKLGLYQFAIYQPVRCVDASGTAEGVLEEGRIYRVSGIFRQGWDDVRVDGIKAFWRNQRFVPADP